MAKGKGKGKRNGRRAGGGLAPAGIRAGRAAPSREYVEYSEYLAYSRNRGAAAQAPFGQFGMRKRLGQSTVCLSNKAPGPDGSPVALFKRLSRIYPLLAGLFSTIKQVIGGAFLDHLPITSEVTGTLHTSFR